MTASEVLLQKALVGSSIGSGEWNSIQAALRDRAFFSARVSSIRLLDAMRAKVAESLRGNLSASDFRLAIRRELDATGYDPGEDRGTLKDLTTSARLDLIYNTNREMAQGFMQHLQTTSEGALAAAPAYELMRAERRRVPRNWPEIWKARGGTLYDGRMIALKTDPIWTRISRFGLPHPPFDYNSGMDVFSVSRRECLRLGVIDEDSPRQKPPKFDFNANLQATLPFKGIDDPEWRRFKDDFGDQVVYKDGAVVWKGEIMQGVAGGEGSARLGKSSRKLLAHFSGLDREHLENTSLTLTGDWVRQHAGKHVGGREKDPRNIPLTPGDFELIPSLWRNPDNVARGKYAGSSVLQMETFDGGMLNLVIDHRSGAMPLSFWKEKVRGQVT